MRTTLRVVFWCGLVLGAASGASAASGPDTASGPQVSPSETLGLHFQITEAGTGAATSDDEPLPVISEPLSPQQLRRLLGRLPAISAPADSQNTAGLRDRSTPPPRTGATVMAPWPPLASTESIGADEAASAETALRVFRFSPEGEVPLVPQLSMTFSQPMVAVSSQAEAASEVPVRLVPQPAGRWRWVGTRTLVFDPEGGRMPMATEYRLQVPQGTASVHGSVLERTQDFRFSTPPPKLLSSGMENTPQVLQPLLLMRFDQGVDPAEVQARTRLIGPENQPLALERLAPESAELVRALEEQNLKPLEGRWLALRPRQRLHSGSLYRLEVATGLPSLEGSRVTTEAQGWAFSTYGAFALQSIRCGWYAEPRSTCDPDQGWRLEFNNALNTADFDAGTIRVEPAVENLLVHAFGKHLSVTGTFTPRTEYRLTLPARLKDSFGQTHGRAEDVVLRTGDAAPLLYAAGGPLVTLDPASAPSFSVYTRGVETLEAEIYRVRPEQWSEFVRWRANQRNEHDGSPPPGELVAKHQLLPLQSSGLSETVIALRDHLPSGVGHLVLNLRPGAGEGVKAWHRHSAWLQSTRMGLVSVHDHRQISAWVSELETGRALPGVDVSVGDTALRARTGADGMATVALPNEGDVPLIIARLGEDSALLPSSLYHSELMPWEKDAQTERLRWMVFGDRGMYRPSEQVRIKGWLRLLPGDPTGDLELPAAHGARVRWKLTDSHGVEIGEGDAQLSGLGGFDLVIDLPRTLNLGPAMLALQRVEAGDVKSEEVHTHEFWIEEFRRPEYEVRTEADAGPHLLGSRARIEVDANYYSGGALASTPVRWTLYARPTRYVPPARSDFSFGAFSPWWSLDNESGAGSEQRFEGSTDARGRHAIDVEFLGVNGSRPHLLSAEASVSDLNRQAWSASSELLVHAAQHYVGLKTKRSFVQRGETMELEAVVVDIEGALVADSLPQIRLERLVWKQQAGSWSEIAEPAETCDLEVLDSGHLRCRWAPSKGGSYRVDARVQDAQGRTNSSELRLWVAGGEAPPARDVELQELLLVPDRQDPRPGENLQVFVQAPFAQAEGLMTLDRGGVLEQRRFALDQGSATLEIPIAESMVPGFELRLAVVGQAPRTNAQGETQGTQPAAARGSLRIGVPPLSRSLKLDVVPRDAVLPPGGRTELALQLRDAAGAAVEGAELAVMVVDESVLALSDYRLPDPLAVFYSAWPSPVGTHFQHSQVLMGTPEGAAMVQRYAPEDFDRGSLDRITVAGSRILRTPMELVIPMSAPAPVLADSSGGGSTVALRKDFNALALFAPQVRTDAQGRARIELKLPDSLTRYRVMAVAVAGARAFGAGESSITARKPLMLRPSPPRFISLGDRFELPLLVQNQTGQPMLVELALRAQNARLGAAAEEGNTDMSATAAGRSTNVPAYGRVELRIPVAAESVGQARFQAVVRAGEFTDAQSFELPVWLPATREAFATYGSLGDDGRVLQPVRRPADALPQVGGLQIGLASTELQSLTDALLYLVEYPFECNEQRASRVLAIAALRDVLQAFAAPELPAAEKLDEAVERDLQRLLALQNSDGGWSFWTQDERSWPFLSVHVAHAMARAAEKGYSLEAGSRNEALRYLRSMQRHLPGWYHAENQRGLRAYALDVRRRLGDADPAAAKSLLAEAQGPQGLSIEALGWLLPSLKDALDEVQFEALLHHVEQQVSETAGTAQFVAARTDQGKHVLLHSDRRSDAVMLEALLEVEPGHDLIEKLARGLLAHRLQGRWSNTQDNAFVLLAMDRYFRQREGTTPDFLARVWLDRGFAGEQAFRGRSTDQVELRIPLTALGDAGDEVPLLVQKQGPGRLYYRISLDYAPSSLQLDPADHGFAVERQYAAVDDPGDVRRDANGRWRIRAGARVRVELEMVAPARRYHVALVDSLPAGLEALNPVLAVSQSVPVDPERILPHNRWQRGWYEHQNLRDERVEAFTSLLWEGVHRYSYVARATTPGEFIVPPARAEEMYQPETFGRSATDRVVIESP